MSRQRTIVDEAEVEEILALKIQDLNGIKSRLTYNNVWNFNKDLIKNKRKRSNGKSFNLYGYTFWSYGYNGGDYLGKAKIDAIKSTDSTILAGESFTIEIEDILIAVEKFHNNPQELSKRLIKVFEKDRKRVESLKEQNEKLTKEVIKLRKNIELFKKGFLTLFHNSIYTDNSLNDVMSLKKNGDPYILEELKNMFNENENSLSKILKPRKQETQSSDIDTVIDMHDKIAARKKLDDLF